MVATRAVGAYQFAVMLAVRASAAAQPADGAHRRRLPCSTILFDRRAAVEAYGAMQPRRGRRVLTAAASWLAAVYAGGTGRSASSSADGVGSPGRLARHGPFHSSLAGEPRSGTVQTLAGPHLSSSRPAMHSKHGRGCGGAGSARLQLIETAGFLTMCF
jgi:hypothetical protein